MSTTILLGLIIYFGYKFYSQFELIFLDTIRIKVQITSFKEQIKDEYFFHCKSDQYFQDEIVTVTNPYLIKKGDYLELYFKRDEQYLLNRPIVYYWLNIFKWVIIIALNTYLIYSIYLNISLNIWGHTYSDFNLVLSVYAFLGLLLILDMFIVNSYIKIRRLINMETVSGKVVEVRQEFIKENNDSESNVFHTHIVYFWNGVEYHITPNISSSFKIYSKNDNVKIILDKEFPHSSGIHNGSYYLFQLLGFCFVIVAFALFLLS